MTSVKLIIHDKRLGFTLDKNKSTPTIDKISPGGALEKLLIDNCSGITKGTQIMTIGGYDVMNMSYSDAFEKIRSLNERPINIVFLTNQKVEKISESTMNSISESATREALKDLYIMGKSQKSGLDLEFGRDGIDICDLVFDSEEEETIEEYARIIDEGHDNEKKYLELEGKYVDLQKKYVDLQKSKDDKDGDKYYVTIQKYENLEKKYHYLQLELMTKSSDYEDKCEYIEKKYSPISKIDGILFQIDGLKKRINNIDSRLLTSRELKIKLDKFDEEYSEYIKILENTMKLVKLNMIQTSVKVYIENDIKSMKKMYSRYKMQIMIKKVFEAIQTSSTIVVIIGLMYTIRPYY